MTEYRIAEVDQEDVEVGLGVYQAYGAAADFWRYKGQEVIIEGPAETGKTRVSLEKLDALCWKYPNSYCAMVRKTRKSANTSVVQSYIRKVIGAWDEENQRIDPSRSPIRILGGANPGEFHYPNGSKIIVGGMDNPDKFLSAEYDFAYVNQAEELDLEDWEKLLTRVTGRAGNAPYAQVMGDANPGPATHWIMQRRKGGRLKTFKSRHVENPTLYNQRTGELTEQGKKSMEVLEGLTGVRRKRLYEGLWVSAEGLVYDEYSYDIHVVDRFQVPESWRKIISIDFGYTHPFVCQWWAFDHDLRMYLYREIYMTHRLVEDHAAMIAKLSGTEEFDAVVTDHDAEDRATLERHLGIATIPALKSISPGIQWVKRRLQAAGDGKPRLFVMRDALVETDEYLVEKHKTLSTEQEFPEYVWDKGRNDDLKQKPVKDNDHGMDAMRYAVMFADYEPEDIKEQSLVVYEDHLSISPY